MIGIGVGEGIAIFSVCGMITTAIIKFIPRKNNNPPPTPGNPVEFVSQSFCDERSKNIQDRLDRMHGYLGEVKKEILTAIEKNNH